MMAPELARVIGLSHVALIRQPEQGAFRRWAYDVLNMQDDFSLRQARIRGFDYNNVVSELVQAGILSRGDYQLTEDGISLLRAWLER